MPLCDMCKKEVDKSHLCKLQAECTSERKSYSYWVCPNCLRKVVAYVEQ